MRPIALIKLTVAREFGVTVKDLESDRRQAEVVVPRHVAMYLCRHLTVQSVTAIGNAFGRRDHSTVTQALKSLEGRFQADPTLLDTVTAIKEELTPQLLTQATIDRAALRFSGHLLLTRDSLQDRFDRTFNRLNYHAEHRPFALLEGLEMVLHRLDQSTASNSKAAAE